MSSTISTPGAGSATAEPAAATVVRSSAPGGRPACRVLAFTIIELLIVLAIVLAFSAIVVPSTIELLDERAFSGAGDVVTGQMLLARAHAQENGRPVEVVYRPADRSVRVRWFDVERIADAMADERAVGPDAVVFREEEEEHLSRIPEPWTARRLGRTIRLTDEPPEEAVLGFGGPLDLLPADVASDPEDAPPIRLAVYLPDGSTLIRRDVWLVDDDDRVAAVRTNPFTGRPEIERLLAPPEPAEEEDEESDEEALEDEAAIDDEGRDDGVRDRSSDPGSRDSDGGATDEAPTGQGGRTTEGPGGAEDEDERSRGSGP
jgi:hypothetical protein